jgi:hypothetical protein
MPEISQFKVTKAFARFDPKDGSLELDFHYPKNPKPIESRLGSNPRFGVETLNTLIDQGYARIATPDNPISPPNAGSLPYFLDCNFVCNRRDDGAPVHKMYHSPYSGFASNKDELYTANGMMRLAARESAEEVIFITRDRNPHLVVTKTTREHTIRSAIRLGIDYPIREVGEYFLPGRDKLNVYDEDGGKIFSMNNFFTMLWDVDASTIAMQIRRLDICSDEIWPIDTEGIFTDDGNGYRRHFNRESFIVDPTYISRVNARNLDELNYCNIMTRPQVFRSWFDGNGRLEVYRPLNSDLEYLGPGAVPVNSSYLWAPQDTLRACLDGLGIPGYEGRKLHLERELDKLFLDNQGDESCVIPDWLLVK